MLDRSLTSRREVGRQTGVMIPASVEELDETNIPFGKSARHQAMIGKRTRLTGIFPVKIEGGLGFMGQVGQLRYGALHALSHSYWAMRVRISDLQFVRRIPCSRP